MNKCTFLQNRSDMSESGSRTPLHNCRHNDFQKAIMLNSIALLDSWTKLASASNQIVNETSGAVRSASCPPATYTYKARRESTSHDAATQAAKEAVFNMLYQYQAIPVKAKILSDCILSTLDESEVTNLLDSAGWSRSDYLRGYRTMQTGYGIVRPRC
ncbi:hypothetical protein KIN20_029436 [Parelaphostrongylus tenuis]|uniref:Uncharacterized protein n=1 Tax=Parelaphostrongylus tenuis TaxID=148309 RepID=A0AAD5R2D0_PARTN|nr:hypothetical protein KIN20_029436 [Parelaphostrongylus tenuis]